MKWAVVLSVAFFVACGGHRGFYREGATYQDFYRDIKECEAEASPEWSFCAGDACSAMAGEQIKRRNRCMMARNWIIRKEEPKFVP